MWRTFEGDSDTRRHTSDSQGVPEDEAIFSFPGENILCSCRRLHELVASWVCRNLELLFGLLLACSCITLTRICELPKSRGSVLRTMILVPSSGGFGIVLMVDRTHPRLSSWFRSASLALFGKEHTVYLEINLYN